MKNILARGGIEFLAVIMGISGSLWLDDNNTYKNDRKQEYEAYDRLSNALSQDIKIIDNALIENDRRLEILESMMKNIENLSDDTLSTYIDQTQNYVNINPHISDYETLKNTGRLYAITPLVIVKTLKGRGVKPAKNIIQSQAKNPPFVDILSCISKTFSS